MGGGPAEAVRQLGVELQKNGGHETHVVTLDDPREPWLGSFPLPVHPVGPAYTHYRYTPKLSRWLRANASGYDAVIVNGIWQYGAWATWRALRASATPYFVFPHGMLDPWFKQRYPLKHLKKWLYWPWADYRVLRDARAVVFTTEEEKLRARESFVLYRCNEQVVRIGTRTPTGDPDSQLAAFYARFPELREKRILLFLGRLDKKKGCDLLVRAFGKITSLFPPSASGESNGLASTCHPPTAPSDLHLVIAGPCAEDAYFRNLLQLATEHCSGGTVSFPGMLEGDIKWGALRAADAFILPSHQENFGIAVAEALACDTPVLISNKVNIWREIQASESGLVEDDTVEGTQRLMQRWILLPAGVKDAMRRNARKCFDEYFEIAAAARNLVQLIETLVSTR